MFIQANLCLQFIPQYLPTVVKFFLGTFTKTKVLNIKQMDILQSKVQTFILGTLCNRDGKANDEGSEK